MHLTVQANRDFLSFVEQHESTIHLLCKNAVVHYFSEQQEMQLEDALLEKDMVVNITV